MEKSPSSSIDAISVDEGVESKGSTDETLNLGVSPSAYVSFYILYWWFSFDVIKLLDHS